MSVPTTHKSVLPEKFNLRNPGNGWKLLFPCECANAQNEKPLH